MSIVKKDWKGILPIVCVAIGATCWITAAVKDIKIEQVRLEGAQNLSEADESKKVLSHQLRESEAQRNDSDRKLKATYEQWKEVKQQKEELARQNDEFKKSGRILRQTQARVLPPLRLTEAEFLAKADAVAGGPDEAQFKKDCIGTSIKDWTCVFREVIDAPSTALNQGIEVVFDEKYTVVGRIFLLDPNEIASFRQVKPGTRLRIASGALENILPDHVLVGDAQVTR